MTDIAPMKPLTPMTKQVLTVAVLGGTFLFTASIFTPDESGADDNVLQALDRLAEQAAAAGDEDPHAGLKQLGSLMSLGYRVDIYATPSGPRYSVYDETAVLLAALLTSHEVAEQFSDLPIPSMGENGPVQMMRVDPDVADPR